MDSQVIPRQIHVLMVSRIQSDFVVKAPFMFDQKSLNVTFIRNLIFQYRKRTVFIFVSHGL